MEVKYVEQQHICGFSSITNNEAEMTPGRGKIPALWQKFNTTIPVNYQGGERVYGVYSDYESDHTGTFGVDFEHYPNANQIDVYIAVN